MSFTKTKLGKTKFKFEQKTCCVNYILPKNGEEKKLYNFLLICRGGGLRLEDTSLQGVLGHRVKWGNKGKEDTPNKKNGETSFMDGPIDEITYQTRKGPDTVRSLSAGQRAQSINISMLMI